MKKMYRFFAVVVSFVFLVSMLLSGCSAKQPDQTSTTTQTQTEMTTVAETQEKALTEEEKTAKYDPAITLTTVKGISATYKFPEGDSLENNAYSRLIEEELGIKIKYNWVVDETQVANRLSLMYASNDFPDFFEVDNKDYTNLVKNDALMDITELNEKWTSEVNKGYIASFQEGFDSAYVNGKLYGIPRLGFGTISLPDLLWMRNDWLQQSGMQAPKTIAELEAVALKFMEQHPGSYGLALEKELGEDAMSIEAIANGNNAFYRSWIKKDGKIVYGSIQPEMKQTLATLQSWYKKGIIHKEFGVKDSNKTIEDITAGKVGIQTGKSWNGWWPCQDSQQKGADWKAYEVPTLDGSLATLQGGWPIGTYVVINKECKNPEAVYKLMNHWTKKVNEGAFNEPKFSELNSWCYPAQQTNPKAEEENYKALVAALDKEDTSELTDVQKMLYDNAIIWKKDKDISGFGRYAQMAQFYPIAQKYVDANKIQMTQLRGADPDGYAAIKSTLQKLELDTFTKIIMGGSLDDFDKFVQQWNTLGGEAATKEINELYNK